MLLLVLAAACGGGDQPAARRQIGDFFRTGQIVDHCQGACVCPENCD